LKYRAEVDGLRALAVVPVILFHAGFELFSGGFVGVDVFFVISGYLITTILIEDIENKRFSIINFYERRARRILPALFFVMLVCIPFAWMWSFNEQLRLFFKSLVAVSLFASNILFWREVGYFDSSAEEKPLLHTWSLAVEEQYYVLFPIFLFLAWRYGKNRVFWMIVVMASISLLLSEWGWRNKATANFYLAPTRAWELFAGSISAFIVQKQGVKKNNSLALLGLAAIVFSIFFYDETTPFPSVYALAPVLGVVLLVLYAERETFAARLLGSKVMVGIGLLSYSAYLWHQPLLSFSRWRNLGESLPNSISIIIVLLTFFCAGLTYRFIETPIRTKNILKTKSAMLSFSLFGIMAFSIIGSSVYFLNERGTEKVPTFVDGFLQQFDIDYQPDNFFLIAESWQLQKSINGISFFQVENIEKDRKLLFPQNNSKENLLVVGNSQSVDFYNVLSFSTKITSHFNIARFGTNINNIDDEFFASPNYISADTIVLCSLMGKSDLDNLERVAKAIINDGKHLFICENIFTWMERSTYTKLDHLIVNGLHNKILPITLSEQINAQYTHDFTNRKFATIKRREIFLQMKKVLDYLNSQIDFTVLDRMNYVCSEGVCSVVSDRLGKYFFDMGHHTMLGAKYFGSVIDTNGFASRIVGE
jgi:peptidoglycan/LPS O-acetylase OafA/YrhL